MDFSIPQSQAFNLAGLRREDSLFEKIKTEGVRDLNELKLSGRLDDQQKLKAVAEEFESIFVKMVVDSMSKTVEESEDGLFGKSMGRDIFNDMLREERSKEMSRSSSFGIAKAIYEQVSNPGVMPSEIKTTA